jgi:hypothetical protein
VHRLVEHRQHLGAGRADQVRKRSFEALGLGEEQRRDTPRWIDQLRRLVLVQGDRGIGPDERRGPQQQPSAVESACCFDGGTFDAKLGLDQRDDRREVVEELGEPAVGQRAGAAEDVPLEHVP